MTATVLLLSASHRSMARGRMAANEVRARGGDAMEAAIAQIRATFDDELRADMMRQRAFVLGEGEEYEMGDAS